MNSRIIFLLVILSLASCATKNLKIDSEPNIHSIEIGNLDNLRFHEHIGKPEYVQSNLIKYNCEKSSFTKPPEKLENDSNYVSFICYHFSQYIDYFEDLFEGRVDFSTQKEYLNLKILWGAANYQTSPNKVCPVV